MVTKNSIRSWCLKLTVGVLILWSLFFLFNFLFPLPAPKSYSTLIRDKDGEILHCFLTEDEKWRLETQPEEISRLLKKTLLAKEDRYFYYHPGINPLALGRALLNNILQQKRTSGASTITMQVARLIEPKSRSYSNKLIEMFRSIQLELRYTKEEIFQFYISMAPYGGNIEGVKAASWLYFNKNPDHLSLAEITALSIIPNRPSSLVIGKHNQRILEERNRWLKIFEAENIFSSAEIEDALEEPLTAGRGSFPKKIPHLAQKLKHNFAGDIRTTIDANMQFKIEELVSGYMRPLKQRRIQNAAVIVIRNADRKVVAYLGSANFQDSSDGGQVNGAKAVRQPGSTLKPLLYGLAVDEGLLTPATVINDVSVNYGGYAPENYDRKFNGRVSMEYALEHSLNIPAVNGLQLIGQERMIEALAKAGFEQIRKDRRKLGLSLALGGCGASLEELAGLYSSFANDGVYSRPAYLEAADSLPSSRIISPASAYMITDILSRVNRPDFPINWESTERMPRVAWKTGTSYGRRDAWSIGYNKEFTVGVWLGNFSGVGATDINGATIATPLLFKIFNTIDYDSDREWFNLPEDADMRLVCSNTGLIPSIHCSNTVSDEYIPLISSTKICTHLREIAISPDEQYSYCRNCQPESGFKKKLFPRVEPELQQYYAIRNIHYEKIPPHNPRCERVFRAGEPLINSPTPGSTYYISRSNPEPLALKASVEHDIGTVFWYINDRFYKSADSKTTVFFMPEEGLVKISCTDDKGRNRDIKIQVSFVDL